MIILSINLLILSVGLLIVGLVKPHWILFWMEKPRRMPVVMLSVVLFMTAVVMFGEANRQKEIDNQAKIIEETDTSPIPVEEEGVKIK